MFALGIVDKLTPGALTGGRHVAGTGTIDDAGEVGAIGGIAQKMIGAKNAGAKVFLVPEANCAEAVKTAPDGLRLVKVTTLKTAVAALDALAKNGTADLPACAA
jgi:PDZ domain-containing protein